MESEKNNIIIRDLKRGVRLRDSNGSDIEVEGINATGYCIVKKAGSQGPSTTVHLDDLNKNGYSIIENASTKSDANFYDIFNGLILENKVGEFLYINEIENTKIIVESENGNTTVTDLKEVIEAGWKILKPKQVPEESVVLLSIKGRRSPIIGIAANYSIFGYNFLKIREFEITSDTAFGLKDKDSLKETKSFSINYDMIDRFMIFDDLESVLKKAKDGLYAG